MEHQLGARRRAVHHFIEVGDRVRPSLLQIADISADLRISQDGSGVGVVMSYVDVGQAGLIDRQQDFLRLGRLRDGSKGQRHASE